MSKNFKLQFISFIALIFLSGCGAEKPFADQSAADGSYWYNNKDLGFSLVLPPEFEYYQTQRKENEGNIELEIFVPTSDPDFGDEVPGYARPIDILIFDLSEWDRVKGEQAYVLARPEIFTKDGRAYVIIFWPVPPVDWKDKWSEDMRQNILGNFKLL